MLVAGEAPAFPVLELLSIVVQHWGCLLQDEFPVLLVVLVFQAFSGIEPSMLVAGEAPAFPVLVLLSNVLQHQGSFSHAEVPALVRPLLFYNIKV